MKKLTTYQRLMKEAKIEFDAAMLAKKGRKPHMMFHAKPKKVKKNG